MVCKKKNIDQNKEIKGRFYFVELMLLVKSFVIIKFFINLCSIYIKRVSGQYTYVD